MTADDQIAAEFEALLADMDAGRLTDAQAFAAFDDIIARAPWLADQMREVVRLRNLQ